MSCIVVSKQCNATQANICLFGCSSDQHIELEIPPDFGNGPWNAGIPLARLLWHVPVQGLMTLLAALLLERRVILVAQDKDKVSAAVHAAAALLYPFRWQHIYLPLLPIALKVSKVHGPYFNYVMRLSACITHVSYKA